MVAEDFSQSEFDAHLASFVRFRERPEDAASHARPWQKAAIASVGPHQVSNIAVEELAVMAAVAMEIEEPVHIYSLNNREGFRHLLPLLGRFMGGSLEGPAVGGEPGKEWCESPWCAEEQRHANTFYRILQRLVPVPPTRANPNQPRTAAPDRASALALFISREAAEWNSSSTYSVMAAHAEGDLHILLRNIARDEIKHLSVLSAADAHLFGPRPWSRFLRLVRNGLQEYRGHKAKRTRGHELGQNPVTAFEVIVAHLLTEWRIRRWLQRLTAVELAAVFDPVPTPEAHRIS
jgi:hypothetical protein